jgi:hypothetical protein
MSLYTEAANEIKEYAESCLMGLQETYNDSKQVHVETLRKEIRGDIAEHPEAHAVLEYVALHVEISTMKSVWVNTVEIKTVYVLSDDVRNIIKVAVDVGILSTRSFTYSLYRNLRVSSAKDSEDKALRELTDMQNKLQKLEL